MRRGPGSRRLRLLEDRLSDERSKKVAFVAHCLLNQNVRYLGGASRPAMVEPVVDELRRRNVGIVQLPCPEQAAWGGVLKPWMLRLYGSKVARTRPGRRLLVAAARRWTIARYRRLARGVARDVAGYVRAGYDVTEIIGVGPSPTCGVATTIDLAAGIAAMARCEPATIDREVVNVEVVRANATSGRGLFMDALLPRLERLGIRVPVREHDLLAELGRAPAPLGRGTPDAGPSALSGESPQAFR